MKITYPTKLSEIPLGNYQKWMNTALNSNDTELIAHKFVEIFLGVKLNEVRNMNAKDVNFFIEKVSKVLNTKPKFKKRWKYGNVELGLIPDLENMSWGEYIDIESNLTDIKNWNKALAVLYRPVIDTYKDTYKIAKYTADESMHDAMKYAPLDIALGVQVFFWNLEKELLEHTLSSLNKEMKKMTIDKVNTAKHHNLANNGDGITASIKSVKGILTTLNKLPPYPSIKFSHSYPMKYKKIELNTIQQKDK